MTNGILLMEAIYLKTRKKSELVIYEKLLNETCQGISLFLINKYLVGKYTQIYFVMIKKRCGE
jgi:hypothetical protein